MSKGPFIIYGREGAGDFGEGATYFWQVAERGGPLIFGKSLRGGATYFWREKILKSPRNPFFDTFSYAILGRGPLIFGKSQRGGPLIFGMSLRGGATYFWQVADGGGPLIFGSRDKQNLRPPLP